MSYGIVPFIFKGEEVRIVNIDCDAWFVAKDLSNVLGMKNAREIASHLLRSDEKRILQVPVKSFHTSGNGHKTERMLAVNESGLYTLIMRSTKPEAQEFRYKVTSEILPALRKTGSYDMPSKMFEGKEESLKSAELTDSAYGLQVTLNITVTGDIKEVRRITEVLLGR